MPCQSAGDFTQTNALILAPFHPEALQRLKGKLEVFYESWMETKRLLSPEEMVQQIQRDDLQIVVMEADFIFEDVLENVDKLPFVPGTMAAGKQFRGSRECISLAEEDDIRLLRRRSLSPYGWAGA